MADFDTCLFEELSDIVLAFPINAPEQTPAPYLVYNVGGGVTDKTLDGFLESERITGELDIICNSFESLKTIEAEVIQRLQSFERRAVGISAPVFVQAVRYEEPIRQFEPELKQYRVNIEFNVNI